MASIIMEDLDRSWMKELNGILLVHWMTPHNSTSGLPISLFYGSKLDLNLEIASTSLGQSSTPPQINRYCILVFDWWEESKLIIEWKAFETNHSTTHEFKKLVKHNILHADELVPCCNTFMSQLDGNKHSLNWRVHILSNNLECLFGTHKKA